MNIDPKSIRLERGPTRGRYTYEFSDGSQAEMDYIVERPGLVKIIHTGTPRPHRGQGVAAALVSRAVADFQAAGQQVIPACWYARDQFKAHPDWDELLYRG